MTGLAGWREAPARVECLSVRPAWRVPNLAEDARRGLLTTPRTLPPKYFYDALGSRLFERICETPEYYPTRTENALLVRHSEAIVARVAPDQIIELGSGTSHKTRHLLNACEVLNRHPTYWPFDVCESVLRETASALISEYPWLRVNPLVGDYHGGLRHLPEGYGRHLFVFFGGTIGNFEDGAANRFLADLRAQMQPGDWLLLGADRIKDTAVLNAAYNDAAGITAEFNLNVLRVLNRELGADFQLEHFRHQAVYVPQRKQIEMYLVSERTQKVRIHAFDARLDFSSGERILTEISRKFTFKDLRRLLTSAGLQLISHFEPENQYFSLLLAKPTGSRDARPAA
jgi:probable methyltransferase